MNKIQVLDIKYGTSVDGIGLRTSIYCAGCEHHCKGCHNPQSWNDCGGVSMSVQTLFELIVKMDMNVTFTGGDPMFHPEGFISLAQLIKAHTNKTIWCYTGYSFEHILNHPIRKQLLLLCDVLVDGPFKEEEKDLSLPFRGSKNQRLIDIKKSIMSNKVIEFSI